MGNGQASMEMLYLIGGVAVFVLIVIVVIFNFEAITEGQIGDVFKIFTDVIDNL